MDLKKFPLVIILITAVLFVTSCRKVKEEILDTAKEMASVKSEYISEDAHESDDTASGNTNYKDNAAEQEEAPLMKEEYVEILKIISEDLDSDGTMEKIEII